MVLNHPKKEMHAKNDFPISKKEGIRAILVKQGRQTDTSKHKKGN